MPSGWTPIKVFFESLAQDQHERVTGVVLSGTTSAGRLRLRQAHAEVLVIARMGAHLEPFATPSAIPCVDRVRASLGTRTAVLLRAAIVFFEVGHQLVEIVPDACTSDTH